ncbi:MAG: hypothetical protein ACRDH2_06265 [Anaerolineales bacterium]
MLYQAVFHPDHADPPFTLWLIEIEGPNPTFALKWNLRQVMGAAKSAAREYFGADLFTQEELQNQIHVVDENEDWFAAKDM